MCFTDRTLPACWPEWVEPSLCQPGVSTGGENTWPGAGGHTCSVQITEVTEVTPELMAAFERLIPQLSSSNPPPSVDEVQFIVDSPASVLLIAEEDGEIYGSLTLALFRIPTGMRAWIEDVVVDDAARGKGVGRLLNEVAIERAREVGATTVDLTSRPSREAANRLYKRIGFEERDTNVYRYKL